MYEHEKEKKSEFFLAYKNGYTFTFAGKPRGIKYYNLKYSDNIMLIIERVTRGMLRFIGAGWKEEWKGMEMLDSKLDAKNLQVEWIDLVKSTRFL